MARQDLAVSGIGAKGPLSGHPLSTTISRDNTKGNEDRAAKLLAEFGRKNKTQSSSLKPSTKVAPQRSDDISSRFSNQRKWPSVDSEITDRRADEEDEDEEDIITVYRRGRGGRPENQYDTDTNESEDVETHVIVEEESSENGSGSEELSGPSSAAARRRPRTTRAEDEKYLKLPKMGITKFPSRLATWRAVAELGYPAHPSKRGSVIVIEKALTREQVTEVIKISKAIRKRSPSAED